MFVYLRLPLSVSQEPLSGDNYCFSAIFGAATFINAEHFRDQEENTWVFLVNKPHKRRHTDKEKIIEALQYVHTTHYCECHRCHNTTG